MNTYPLKKALPTILLGLSTVGLAGTGILAARAGEKSYSKKLAGESTLKSYIPTFAVGAATVACMWASHILSKKQIAALIATCGYLAASKDKIEEKIRERFGEEQLAEIKREVMAEMEHEPWGKGSIPSAEETGNGNLLVLEGYSGRAFRSSIMAVDAGIKEFQDMILAGAYCSLNDLYTCLGISQTHFGNQFGWPGSDDYLEFYNDHNGIKIQTEYIENPVGMDEPVYVIDIYDYPMEFWEEM